jgi:hypothetical protein
MLPRPHTIGRPSICPWGRAATSSGITHAEHKVSKIVAATAALCGMVFTPIAQNECSKAMAGAGTRSFRDSENCVSAVRRKPHRSRQRTHSRSAVAGPDAAPKGLGLLDGDVLRRDPAPERRRRHRGRVSAYGAGRWMFAASAVRRTRMSSRAVTVARPITSRSAPR